MALERGGKQVGGNFDSGWIRGVRIWKPSGNRVCVEWQRFLSAWPSSSTLFRALFRYSPTKGITKEKREEEWGGSCTADEKYGKAERGKGKQKKGCVNFPSRAQNSVACILYGASPTSTSGQKLGPLGPPPLPPTLVAYRLARSPTHRRPPWSAALKDERVVSCAQGPPSEAVLDTSAGHAYGLASN
jgi:hypothetical protein